MGHIYDKEFLKKELPMTKQEIRAVSIAKLQLKPDSILIDVGAGTGTIGIEAGTYLKDGRVFSIEKEEKGIDTFKKNIKRFELENIEVLVGKAPEMMPKISYDRVFIGGSTGSMRLILEHILKYGANKTRVVINVITLETLYEATTLLKELNFKNIEIVNIMVSRGKEVGRYTMMYAENPIYIITAEKEERI